MNDNSIASIVKYEMELLFVAYCISIHILTYTYKAMNKSYRIQMNC